MFDHFFPSFLPSSEIFKGKKCLSVFCACNKLAHTDVSSCYLNVSVASLRFAAERSNRVLMFPSLNRKITFTTSTEFYK